MIEIRRILCPIDFSDDSRRALDHAMTIARWYESTVTALHVFSSAPVAASGVPPTPERHSFSSRHRVLHGRWNSDPWKTVARDPAHCF